MKRLSSSARHDLSATGCEIRDDKLDRRLYATDASIYEIEPAAIGFPRSTHECSALVKAAGEHHLEITPRGAGTGLVGGALGPGLVIDMARHGRWIEGLDLEKSTVRVGPGVVLDQLNAFLKPHGLCFGPDVATSSRATLGGMIANNSSGAHSPIYGTTADHVIALETVLADGRTEIMGAGHAGYRDIRKDVTSLVENYRETINQQLPQGLVKRWSGYGFDTYLRTNGDLTRLISGSEGTLALITAAELNIVKLPAAKSLCVLFFASVKEAMAATAELTDLRPAAVEHLDARVFDQTRGQLAFARARSLLDLDAQPCAAMLIVEFFDDIDDQVHILAKRQLGIRHLICLDPVEQELVWTVRRAGLSLLTGCAGPAKPTACIEDVCVRSGDLPAYVDELEAIMTSLGLEASYYGHAAAGELHVRPVLDLHSGPGIRSLRAITDAVSELTLKYQGSLAAEHGLGIARTEYLRAHLGPELSTATRDLKRLFDPSSLLNPGKIVDTGRYRVDQDLRFGSGYRIELPFFEQLSYQPRDHSFVNNLEQCNGCGGCRKDSATMCPTFLATGEELESTRGRANVIRSALDGHFGQPQLNSDELKLALSDCLACKACAAECPSGVDLAKLKAEMLNAGHDTCRVPLRDRLIASADTLGRLGAIMPRLANRVLSWRWLRQVIEATLGFAADRALPTYTTERFDHWFLHRKRIPKTTSRETVVLWDDTWVRYHETGVGHAAVFVLETAGFEVILAEERHCCGRPAFSRGLIGEARKDAVFNINLLNTRYAQHRIIFLEPSCYSMFVDEYCNFSIPGADELSSRCVLFEDLILEVLDEEPEILEWKQTSKTLVIHNHCHAKALTDTSSTRRLAEKTKTSTVRILNTGCCGMAGAFGMLADKQKLSLAVAEPLREALSQLDSSTHLVASGTSCRHQIRHISHLEPQHIAEILAENITCRAAGEPFWASSRFVK